jgi:uncharacterized protein YeaC (DUF1315 family)
VGKGRQFIISKNEKHVNWNLRMNVTVKQTMRLLTMMELKKWADGIKKEGKIKDLSLSITTKDKQNIERTYTHQTNADIENTDSHDLIPAIHEEHVSLEQDWFVNLLRGHIKKFYDNTHDYCIRLESQRGDGNWSLEDSERRWKDLVEAVVKIRKTGKRAADLASNEELFTRAVTGYGYYPYLIPAAFAVAYCMDAEESIQNSTFHHASFCIERAQFWSSDDSKHKELPEALQKRASAGGKARSKEHTIPVKQEFIRLLGFPPNSNGWESRVKAATDCENCLKEFISLHYPEDIALRYPMRRISKKDEDPGKGLDEDLHSKMLRWMREDVKVKAAYLAKAGKKSI